MRDVIEELRSLVSLLETDGASPAVADFADRLIDEFQAGGPWATALGVEVRSGLEATTGLPQAEVYVTGRNDFTNSLIGAIKAADQLRRRCLAVEIIGTVRVASPEILLSLWATPSQSFLAEKLLEFLQQFDQASLEQKERFLKRIECAYEEVTSTAGYPTELTPKWTEPMTQAEAARRILRKWNVRGRKINRFWKKWKKEKNSPKTWFIDLDSVEPRNRKLLCIPLPPPQPEKSK